MADRPFAQLPIALLFAAGSTARAQDVPPPKSPPPAAAPATNLEIPPGILEELRSLKLRVKSLEEQAAKPRSAAPAAPTPTGNDYGPAKVPFAFADFTWVPGNWGSDVRPLSAGPFVGELRIDVPYHWEMSNPIDHTISGSSEVFRHNEFQVTQIGFGGDFYYKGVHARLMTQFGMYSQTTPRNDASPALGQWQLDNAYRYISEAYAGYHINVMHGINIQAGIFMSYVGLWSYYNFDNWTYQPSYVSSNTPWFFNGMRIQIFPTEKLKIEPWLVNGWQAYGKFNQAPGLGLQILWRPRAWLSILGNQYWGTDALGIPNRSRVHTDDSIMARFYNAPDSRGLSMLAGSLTVDLGCEFGDEAHNVTCTSQYFIGFMTYLRAWFFRNTFAATFGGGWIDNPGRYLVLVPPINGATAFSGTPFFTENPGDGFKAWDLQVTADYLPNRYITFRAEYNHRAADRPYFNGPGGMTPLDSNGNPVNQGPPGSLVPGFTPDLVPTEDRFTIALLVKM
jgi:hypothetical protein